MLVGTWTLLMTLIWAVSDEMLNRVADYLAKKHRAWRERRRVMRMLRDDDNPQRVTRRRHRAKLLDKAKMHAFFVSVFILTPIAGLSFGIWRMQQNKATGGLIVLITISGTVQLWLNAVVSTPKQENEKW